MGLTVDEVRDAWPQDENRPSVRSLGQDLKVGIQRSLWQVAGSGRRGDPYRYFRHEDSIRASSLSIGARIESEEHNR